MVRSNQVSSTARKRAGSKAVVGRYPQGVAANITGGRAKVHMPSLPETHVRGETQPQQAGTRIFLKFRNPNGIPPE